MRTLSILMAGVMALAACGRGAKQDQQQYEVVEEGSASGVTGTIHGPGETVPPITNTNADTTTAFTIDPNALPPRTQQPGTIAGTFPPPSPPPMPPPMTSSPPPPSPRPEPPPPPPTQTEPAPEPEEEPQPQPPPPADTAPPPSEDPEEEEPPVDSTAPPPPPLP
ncbi:MAG TPA: hypothetical protein VNA69_02445 [Thermoanaerobaculia bacterium]|nr:hypothetical protein [Thermoanaerobaculia bacterium]